MKPANCLRHMRRPIFAVMVMALLFVGIHVVTASGSIDNPKAHVEFYVKKYGIADKTASTLVERAYTIFETVLAVADKRGARPPQLKVINSKGDPWAVSLPDGFIVLSLRAVELCYQGGASQSEGDARLAFVFGHELGHMAEDDFWHMETYMALSGDPDCTLLMKLLEKNADVPTAERETKLDAALVKELKADDMGLLYAAMAGYEVHGLLTGPKGDKQSFFTYWTQQISHAGADEKHPSPEERAQLVISRLKGLEEKIEYFKLGARLAHFQRYEDAVYFFEELLHVFPSREVLNDIGYCFLQMALREMPPSQAYKYWLPSVIDVGTRAESFRPPQLRGEAQEIQEAAYRHLKTAMDYFNQACAKDPLYVPSRVNLAVACFYLGRDHIYKARAAVEEALKLAPEDSDLRSLRALIIYREAPDADMWPQAIAILEEIAKDKAEACSVRYNLAALLEERGRSGKAKELWNGLARDALRLPEPYRGVALRNASEAAPPPPPPDKPAVMPPWTLPVEVGADLLKNDLGRKLFSGWIETAFDFQQEKLAGHVYRKPGGAVVLDMDGYVEMVVLRGEELGSAELLRRRCGEPTARKPVAGGIVWYYGNQWAALVQDAVVAEVWVVRK